MVRWLRWHCPPDTGLEIRALAVRGRARYFSVTEAPHNTNFHTWMGKKHFRTPNSGVKGSGANHYLRAPALNEEQQGWMKTDLGVWEPLWSCCPVLATSPGDLLDAGDREGDDQVDHEEYDDNYEFRWKWWVMSKWLDWTLQNHLVSPSCSVASTACSSIHSRIHSTYHVLSGPSSEEHKSLAWSCIIIETKAGSSTGSQAAEELGWESRIK